MYQPIRWDNVNATSLSEASRPLDSAARAFDMGFGALRGVLDQRNTIQDQNFQAGVRNNTNTVMNRLMGVDTVDGFKTAKQGLGAELDGYGAQIDQQAIRNFADQRGSVLQDRALKDISFQHATLDEAQAKDRDRIAGMLASGDKAQIDAAMKELPGMDLRIKADLYRSGNDAQRQLIDRAHADDKHKWDGQLNAANILHMGNQDKIGFRNAATAEGQLGVSQRNASVNEANAMMLLDQRLEDRDAKYRQEYSNTFKNQASSLPGQAVIDDAIASIKDPDDQKQARIAAAEILKKNPNASTNAVVASIKGIDANWAIDILERSAAARNAAKMDANGAGAEDQAYAKNLRATLEAKIAANQSRRDNLAAGGLGLGDRGTGRPASNAVNGAYDGTGKTALGPSATNTPPGSQPEAVAAALQMDRDPAVQALAQRAAAAQQGSAANSAPAQTPLPPKEQIEADYTRAMAAFDQKYGRNPWTPEAQAARQSIYSAKVAARDQLVNDEKATKKAAQQAIIDAATKRNEANAVRQTDLNTKARQAEQQRAVNKVESNIASLQSDLKVYEKRGSVRDRIDIANTNEKLTQALAERERLKKLLGN